MRCAAGHDVTDPLAWRCPDCGAPHDFTDLPPFDPGSIDTGTWSMWRYAAMLPVKPVVTLGEGATPLVPVHLPGGSFLAKLEHLNPTASYKDRGTSAAVSHLVTHGADHLVEDSSGNAGASIAAYAAAAGVTARVYVPATASAAKLRQIAAAGADVVPVPGPRSAAYTAARGDTRGVYASHVWHPAFLLGHRTCAWEIWEQHGRRLPAVVACPVGQGNLFLGLAHGFRALVGAGLAGRMPRMVAVQAAACAPVAAAWRSGAADPSTVDERPTVAEGIRTASPVRGRDLLRVVRSTGGAVLTVSDAAIGAAQRDLAAAGLLVEPTGAVAVAALGELRRRFDAEIAEILVPLTGSGLKTG
ncbi:pyridoxal-phosphate dependent enzyme [Virgisporangium ochraceum]|uniref:Threonine synthase n=1 Tax=Virgisporangium ochraceum TaxID=65505 RepID=A0A8J4EGG3_9ACTN|nr:pyridoxal-phosphate dependent enzyme [Virgisporangium ochraceum]GIJ73869.1 threonine synthase [Virgisporangium ochraceum]